MALIHAKYLRSLKEFGSAAEGGFIAAVWSMTDPTQVSGFMH